MSSTVHESNLKAHAYVRLTTDRRFVSGQVVVASTSVALGDIGHALAVGFVEYCINAYGAYR